MRKKELFNQNAALFEQLKAAELSLSELRGEIAQRDKEIAALKAQPVSMYERKDDSAEKQPVTTEVSALVMPEAEESNDEPAEISDIDYGAQIIGKIVLEAAQVCSRLSSSGSGESVKELINLILGRSEIAKSEILDAVMSDKDFRSKKEQTDLIYEQAVEYFDSIAAQN